MYIARLSYICNLQWYMQKCMAIVGSIRGGPIGLQPHLTIRMFHRNLFYYFKYSLVTHLIWWLPQNWPASYVGTYVQYSISCDSYYMHVCSNCCSNFSGMNFHKLLGNSRVIIYLGCSCFNFAVSVDFIGHLACHSWLMIHT